ncbi:MFS transporter [Rouxiella badensis]|jgi:DHA1 family inner membrane transport protein|uniref:MFS transporter n=1 Tax=Rouxiella badensis TaxID=1646377 RepID=A0A1X0WHF7_9GAMM|nr:MFS transporter [Rouxiella badensis]MCC3704455.1 MFS transporter [Rouxiella badensis]MCC3718508.1 MFS transporter [Rouxiella badensis]MCC3726724.1 MFS transporter [Rouxiella badensis]MCC3738927.1 MFS transporter [Rouxiella badensis]MCC3746502.1 MFS transporter [Rouxiella badensis]
MSSKLPLLALALGSFGIGTTEFAPMGLLPTIATGVGVSIPTAGLLISAYAIGVMIGAPLMTLFMSRYRRKSALVLLMGIFVIGNLLSAIAPNYTLLLLSRVVTSFSHGAFFGLGALVATSLVPVEKRGSAVAIMFSGLTIANIGGVPVATMIGQTIGWRTTFAATAVLGVIAMIGIAKTLPKGEAGKMPEVKKELSVLVRPVVLRSLATTVLGAGAMFTLYTYITPILERLTHASGEFVTAMLMLIGVGFTLGNYISGKLVDRSVDGTLILFFSLLAASMFIMPFSVTSHIGAAVSMVLWGMMSFGLIGPLQMRVMDAAHEAPGMASSVNIGAFNLGNALGAALGGGVLSSGLTYAWIPPAGAVLALLGLVLVVASRASNREFASESA